MTNAARGLVLAFGLLVTNAPAEAGRDCVDCWRRERTPDYMAVTNKDVMARPGWTRSYRVPARTVTIRRPIAVTPPRLVTVPILDSHGQVAWCKMLVPGRVVTAARQVRRPARVVRRHIPPEVHQIPVRVVVEPASERLVAARPRWRPAEHYPLW